MHIRTSVEHHDSGTAGQAPQTQGELWESRRRRLIRSSAPAPPLGLSFPGMVHPAPPYRDDEAKELRGRVAITLTEENTPENPRTIWADGSRLRTAEPHAPSSHNLGAGPPERVPVERRGLLRREGEWDEPARTWLGQGPTSPDHENRACRRQPLSCGHARGPSMPSSPRSVRAFSCSLRRGRREPSTRSSLTHRQ